MTLTAHATVGAVIGLAVGHPALGFSLGFASHFLMDMIPHGDAGISDNFRVHKHKQKHAVAYVAVDAIFAIFLVLFLINTRDIESIRNLTWGVVGGVLPDLLIGVYDMTKTPFLKWFNTVHFWFHDFFVKRKGDVPLYYALLAQLILITYLQTII